MTEARAAWQVETQERLDQAEVAWQRETEKRLSDAEAAWESEVEQRLASARREWNAAEEKRLADSRQALEQEIQHHLESVKASEINHAHQQLTAARAAWEIEQQDCLKLAEQAWRAAETKRLSEMKAAWQAQAEKRLAAAEAASKIEEEERLADAKRAWKEDSEQRVSRMRATWEAELSNRLADAEAEWKSKEAELSAVLELAVNDAKQAKLMAAQAQQKHHAPEIQPLYAEKRSRVPTRKVKRAWNGFSLNRKWLVFGIACASLALLVTLVMPRLAVLVTLQEQVEWQGQPAGSVQHGALVVQTVGANVRSQASMDSPVIAQLSRSETVFELERSGSWVKVILPKNEGQQGWIHSSLLASERLTDARIGED